MLVLAWIGLIWMIMCIVLTIRTIGESNSIGEMLGTFVTTVLYSLVAVFFICYISK